MRPKCFVARQKIRPFCRNPRACAQHNELGGSPASPIAVKNVDKRGLSVFQTRRNTREQSISVLESGAGARRAAPRPKAVPRACPTISQRYSPTVSATTVCRGDGGVFPPTTLWKLTQPSASHREPPPPMSKWPLFRQADRACRASSIVAWPRRWRKSRGLCSRAGLSILTPSAPLEQCGWPPTQELSPIFGDGLKAQAAAVWD
jgi:hypothetical protein